MPHHLVPRPFRKPGKLHLLHHSLAHPKATSYSSSRHFRSRCIPFFQSLNECGNRSYCHHSLSLAPNKDLHVAIVGTGPSGCYTAKYLQSSLQKRISAKTKLSIKSLNIDMIDRLPTPFGLVRSGVAPDHPEVKNVENDFATLFTNNSMNSSTLENKDVGEDIDQISSLKSSISFRGNIQVGKDISLSELQSIYDIVILAYGCESDRKLGIEGESELCGVIPAREFVWYYNGHPDHVDLGKELKDVLSTLENGDGTRKARNVVVIGQGNVALDCARVLVKGEQGLQDTDIASHSLPILGDGIENVTIVGRRGHVQGAFTIKELRELSKLEEEGYGASFEIHEGELDKGLTPTSIEELEGPKGRPKKRIDQLLRDVAQRQRSGEVKKRVTMRFFLQPVAFIPHPEDPSRLGSIRFERTTLEGNEAGKQRACPTGIYEELPADMALVSVGYKGIPLPELDGGKFDDAHGTVKNTHGKVNGTAEALYVSGWLKRGPSGIIGTNIGDAKDTVSSIISDLEEHGESMCMNAQDTILGRGNAGLDLLMNQRNVSIVDWNSYQSIDAVEKDPQRCRTKEQPREKITDITEMLKHR